jgi:hypothetical protein
MGKCTPFNDPLDVYREILLSGNGFQHPKYRNVTKAKNDQCVEKELLSLEQNIQSMESQQATLGENYLDPMTWRPTIYIRNAAMNWLA